ncbi:FUSC family protein [Streptomyces sp. b94]|uniref:FUSC family protein n=1 Tax=Streptomyces sp. b94 TaxID=1827634 RepID=UPI001B371ABF|nr:FUSC family protein [Streptomyces sp. b94]MBQ1095805.1 FUSC family protein [Streptomyces sp. b94]
MSRTVRPARRVGLSLPPWIAHALRAQRGPVPWSAVIRGALAGGPLLLAAVLADRASLGVVAAIAAMLAGINDRPGSRRTSVRRIGVPALAGAVGLLIGTYAGQHLGAVPLTLVLTGLGMVAGGVSAAGTVGSGAGTQLLVTSAVGAGMPLPEPGWQSALAFLAGAGWLLALRLVLPTPGSLTGDSRIGSRIGSRLDSRFGTRLGTRLDSRLGTRLDFRFDGERAAVADVYDAVAALLDAAGTEQAGARRAALTAALDHAQDALAGPRLRRYASSAAERRLHAQYAAALPLGEAATALAWAEQAVPARASEGPRRLAAAVRGSVHAGPLPAPTRTEPALRALDDALLHAAEAFDRGRGRDLHTRRRSVVSLARTVLGAGGREYGLRVGLCFGASVAVAQALHHGHWYGSHQHWYWLPATAVFLVKPDLGPLVSRVLCRAAGTVSGALVFAGFAAVLPRPEGLVALVAVCGALVPVAARHFAAQTTVVTVLVLALVMVGGEPQASVSRIGETLLACAIVLVVGHLPLPGQRGGGIRARIDVADAAAHAYLAHVLSESGDRAARWKLRREAYRTLAEARAAIALAAAELPALARHSEGADEVAAVLERLVDTTTACAVHLDDTGRLTPRHTDRLAGLRDELAERRGRVGRHRTLA